MQDEPPGRSLAQRRWFGRLGVAGVIFGLLLCAGVAVVGAEYYLNCSPVSDSAMRSHEAFVRAHLSDVRDVKTGVGDCDDNGDGYVTFVTGRTPDAARQAFLADQSCVLDGDDPEGLTLVCTSGEDTVYLFFEVSGKGETSGNLYVPS